MSVSRPMLMPSCGRRARTTRSPAAFSSGPRAPRRSGRRGSAASAPASVAARSGAQRSVWSRSGPAVTSRRSSPRGPSDTLGAGRRRAPVGAAHAQVLQGWRRAVSDQLRPGRRPPARPSAGRRPDDEIARYRVDDKGRIRVEERVGGGRRAVTLVAEFVRATPGRALPGRVETASWISAPVLGSAGKRWSRASAAWSTYGFPTIAWPPRKPARVASSR